MFSGERAHEVPDERRQDPAERPAPSSAAAIGLPPEPPYPEEQRKPSSPPDASWAERYEAAVEAENRFLDEDPDANWHLVRAIVPLAGAGVVLVAWLISVLSG